MLAGAAEPAWCYSGGGDGASRLLETAAWKMILNVSSTMKQN